MILTTRVLCIVFAYNHRSQKKPFCFRKKTTETDSSKALLTFCTHITHGRRVTEYNDLIKKKEHQCMLGHAPHIGRNNPTKWGWFIKFENIQGSNFALRVFFFFFNAFDAFSVWFIREVSSLP